METSGINIRGGERKMATKVREKDTARMMSHRSIQERYLPMVEEAVESLQDKMENKEKIIAMLSKHAFQREQERKVSNNDILNILKDGYPIESQGIDDDQSINILMMGYTKVGSGYRPLHLAINLSKECDKVIVKTIYDPRSRDWQWEENYETRIFFVKG